MQMRRGVLALVIAFKLREALARFVTPGASSLSHTERPLFSFLFRK